MQSRRIRARVALWVLAAAGLVAGCGGGGSGGADAPAQTPGVATIGAAGGSVSSTDGVRITVPAGSLADTLTLRIARDTSGLNAALADGTPDPQQAVALSPTYAMTPHGTTFARPVELRIPIDKAAAAGPGLLVALHAAPGQAGWDVMPIQAVENGEAVVAITSFSFYKVVKIVTLPQQLPNTLPVPPKLEMSMTLGGAAATSFNLTNSSGDWTSATAYRRLFGSIANRSDSLRLSGRVVGLPASCANIALAGNASTTQNPTAADTQGGGYVGFNGIAEPVFAELTATQGVNTTGGVQRTTLDFAFDINIANAPYKAQLYANLRSRNLTGATPPVALSFNAFARCTTPVDLGGGLVLQNWKITPGIEQLPWDPTFPDSLLFDDKRWTWNTILFTTDYLPQGFITHPQPVTVAAGTPASFSTSAWPVPVGEQRIEWWRSDDDGTIWTRVRTTLVPVETTADTYTLPAAAVTDNNALFRARLCTVPRSATPAETCTDGIAARLTVLQGVAAANFSQQPRPVLVRSGQTASFSVAATGSPAPSLRWQARPANSSGAWADVGSGSGAASANYSTAVLSVADNGLQLRAVAHNVVGDVPSVPVTVSVSDVDVAPSIVSQPASLSVVAGSEAVFAAVARGTEALSYQWRRNGVAITGANAPVLKLAAVTDADATGYSVQVSNSAGNVVSDVATLSVTAGTPAAVAPSIVTQPVSVLVNAGNTATFAVGVAGSGPFGYQWLKDGQPIAGATNAFHSLSAATIGDAGTYAVQVSNGAGSATSWNVILTVNATAQPTPVTLSTQPSAQVQLPGGSATFAVAANGSAPIAYQWLKDGAPIAGATTAVLTLAGVSAGDAAAYSVSASNVLGGVTSNAASLTVVGAPAITTPPAATSATEGSTASFGVAASGNGLRYQWTRNSVGIAGATAASYTTPLLTLADNGAAYGVVVYNGAGIVFSQGATLTVTAAPPSGPQPLTAKSVTAGYASSFAVAPDGTVWAWGYLVDPTTGGYKASGPWAATPVQVQGLTGVASVSLSSESGAFYALHDDGTVSAWGRNNVGQLGDRTTTTRSLPVKVLQDASTPMDEVCSIAAAANILLMARQTGCSPGNRVIDPGPWIAGWFSGQNFGGATSTPSPLNGAVAVAVPGWPTGARVSRMSTPDAASAAGAAFFVTHLGERYVWGANGSNLLGAGVSTPFAGSAAGPIAPPDALFWSGTARVELGRDFSIALVEASALVAVGRNLEGQLGNGSTTASSTPVPVSVLTQVTDFSVGQVSVAAIRNGELWAWGWNGASAVTQPTRLGTGDAFTAVSRGDLHGLLIGAGGAVYAWGDGSFGALGNGGANASVPVAVNRP